MQQTPVPWTWIKTDLNRSPKLSDKRCQSYTLSLCPSNACHWWKSVSFQRHLLLNLFYLHYYSLYTYYIGCLKRMPTLFSAAHTLYIKHSGFRKIGVFDPLLLQLFSLQGSDLQSHSYKILLCPLLIHIFTEFRYQSFYVTINHWFLIKTTEWWCLLEPDSTDCPAQPEYQVLQSSTIKKTRPVSIIHQIHVSSVAGSQVKS